MTPDEADALGRVAAAYVHIPFCARVCPYCDFAVVAGKDHLAEYYVGAVCAEIGMTPRWRPLEAVYFGGGTPSHLPPPLLGKVVESVEAHHGLTDGAEVSLEANPEDFTEEKAAALRGMGFNRVSFGAQSFDPAVLRALGRRHRPKDIEASVHAARKAGFENVSLDLIYGTPEESDRSWEESLEKALALDPEHISCYALTVELGTPLSRAVRAGAPAPDPDTQADRYRVADLLLTSAGYRRYEVSNWSRPGSECRYNLVVWAQGEYLAYGSGAHGYREGRRFRNIRRLEAYLSRVESGRLARAGEDLISGWDAELDRLFVGLRRTVGVARGPGTEVFLASEEGSALVAAGVVVEEGSRLVVVDPLLTDAVLRAVMSLQPSTEWEDPEVDSLSVFNDARR